jgi:hypothetical protein
MYTETLERDDTLCRQGFGEWLFSLQSPFSTAGLPAALEAAATGVVMSIPCFRFFCFYAINSYWKTAEAYNFVQTCPIGCWMEE